MDNLCDSFLFLLRYSNARKLNCSVLISIYTSPSFSLQFTLHYMQPLPTGVMTLTINGEQVIFGSYETKDELVQAVKDYCMEQVQAGAITQDEADSYVEQAENPFSFDWFDDIRPNTINNANVTSV